MFTCTVYAYSWRILIECLCVFGYIQLHYSHGCVSSLSLSLSLSLCILVCVHIYIYVYVYMYRCTYGFIDVRIGLWFILRNLNALYFSSSLTVRFDWNMILKCRLFHAWSSSLYVCAELVYWIRLERGVSSPNKQTFAPVTLPLELSAYCQNECS